MPRNRSGYVRWTSGYRTVTARRKRFRSVMPIARPTAPTSWPVSRKKPGVPLPLCATGASERDHEAGREQEDDRCGEQELPRDREDLVHADPHEGPAHPCHDEEDEDRLREEPERPEPRP